MTKSAIARTVLPDPAAAGADLGQQIAAALTPEVPHAVILFVSPQYDFEPLLESLHASCTPKLLTGCSSAGEFTSIGPSTSSACAIALHSDEIQFAAGLGTELQKDRKTAARQIVGSFRGLSGESSPYRLALVLTDALAGYTEELMEELTVLTGGAYKLVGGGAGDEARFQRTHVFLGAEAYTDAAVVLEMVSRKPLGIGFKHGWEPAGDGFRVTEAQGMRLISLNSVQAADIFEQHAQQTGQRLDRSDPMPFFLHNVLGIESTGGYKLRVPLAILEDGSVVCAAEVPVGVKVSIMRSTSRSAADAAAHAAEDALAQLGGGRAAVALFFDCAATRLRLGQEFGLELAEVTKALGGAPYAGCNTYGQIARVEGQFDGFHNCTAVVCAIPE